MRVRRSRAVAERHLLRFAYVNAASWLLVDHYGSLPRSVLAGLLAPARASLLGTCRWGLLTLDPY